MELWTLDKNQFGRGLRSDIIKAGYLMEVLVTWMSIRTSLSFTFTRILMGTNIFGTITSFQECSCQSCSCSTSFTYLDRCTSHSNYHGNFSNNPEGKQNFQIRGTMARSRQDMRSGSILMIAMTSEKIEKPGTPSTQ